MSSETSLGRGVRGFGVAVVVLLLVVAPAQAGELEFIPRIDYSYNAHVGVYLADMTGDGVNEVLFGNRYTDAVEIFQYNAEWNFLKLIDEVLFEDDPADTADEPHDVKAADLDKDGDQDLVVGKRGWGLYIAKNTGGPGVVGSWEVVRLNDRYSWQVLVADLDGDGNLDILDCLNAGFILPFYGDGHGGFTEGATIEDPDTDMRFLMGFNLFDHNGDSRPDLIGVDGAYLRVFINPGNRTAAWASVGNVLLADYPSLRPRQAAANVGPSAGDLNGDGHVDQVAFVGTPDEPGAVRILILEGDGTTWTSRTLDTLPWRNYAGHAGVADLNGDGHLDIHVGGGRYFDGLRVYLGDGQGNFRREDISVAYGVGGLNSFAAGDVTGDGRADIVAGLAGKTGPVDESGGIILWVAKTPIQAQPVWTTECVACQTGINKGAVSVKVDGQGNVHMVTGGNDLIYAWRSGQTWHRELVQSGMGEGIYYPSLALDSAGRPHVSYWVGGDKTLRYAYRTAAGWQIELVVNRVRGYSGDLGATSLAIDGLGRPSIAYEIVDFDSELKSVNFAFKLQSEWLTQLIDADASAPSMAVDGDATPHLSFVAKGKLQYARRDPYGQWTITPVGTEAADTTSIAISSAGKVHIVYNQQGAIKLAISGSPNWDVTIIVPTASLERPILAIGPADVLHVAYYNSVEGGVRHAYRSGGTWQNTVLAKPAHLEYFSLAVGPDGTPHAVTIAGNPVAVKHSQATGPAGGWAWGDGVAVFQSRTQGRPSLALDTAARPAISTCDGLTQAVTFARPEAGGWVSQVVDDLSGPCQETELALDSGGKPHVAYLAGEPGNSPRLFYAHQTGSGWQLELVASSPLTHNLALAVDSAARPHLVYIDHSQATDTLVYAYRTTAGWQRTNLLAGAGDNAAPALSLDKQGRPHVAYLHATASGNEIRYAYRDAAGWHTETVQSGAGRVYRRPSLAVGSDGVPRILCASQNEGDAKWLITYFARGGAGGWQSESTGQYAEYSLDSSVLLLALGPDNQPHALNNAVNDVRFSLGTRGAAGWQWEHRRARFTNGIDATVDATGVVHLAGSYGPIMYMTGRQLQPVVGDPDQIISAGEYHTCGLRPSGQADCWGATKSVSDHGQAADQPGPFVQVGAGALHSCGLRPNGSVDCWGSNTYGQAADQTGPFTQLSVGGDHNCGLRADGHPVCWGRNSDGESLDWAGPFLQIGAGWLTTCGLRPDGSVTCWGNNSNGQAQNQTGPFTQLSVGWGHTCGLQLNGGAFCWGGNEDGQATDQAGPFVQISAGGRHTCGLKADGSVVCWGRNGDGQTQGPAGPFHQVSAGGTWTSDDAAWGHSCGIRLNGAVACWGNNDNGQVAGPGGVFGPFRPLTWLPVILRNR